MANQGEETKSFGGSRTSTAVDTSLVLILYGCPVRPKALFEQLCEKIGKLFGFSDRTVHNPDSVDSLERRRKISSSASFAGPNNG